MLLSRCPPIVGNINATHHGLRVRSNRTLIVSARSRSHYCPGWKSMSTEVIVLSLFVAGFAADVIRVIRTSFASHLIAGQYQRVHTRYSLYHLVP